MFRLGVAIRECHAGAVGVHRPRRREPWIVVGVGNSKGRVTDAGRLRIDKDEGGRRFLHVGRRIEMIFGAH